VSNEATQRRLSAEKQARQAAIDALRPRLTPEFLETLVEAARISGYENSDYFEVVKFVEWWHERLGLPVPDLEPYAYGDPERTRT
jgi:hypothetical protein